MRYRVYNSFARFYLDHGLLKKNLLFVLARYIKRYFKSAENYLKMKDSMMDIEDIYIV